jgi:AcrR family transcriptional regulator
MTENDDASPQVGVRGDRVVEIQRARILDALVEVVAERGFGGVSVELVIARARVSRRTFYEIFDGLEDCFVAILDDGLERSSALILQAFMAEDSWRDGLRAGMATLLLFLDSEPKLTWFWMVDALTAGSWALEHRARNIAKLRTAIVSWWVASRSVVGSPPLAAEGVMASAFGLIHTHLVTREPGPLIGLLGPLMGIVTGPYLDQETVAEEIRRGERLSRKIQSETHAPLARGVVTQAEHPTLELPAMLCNPKSARARLCVLYLARHPGSNNRQVGSGIGVTHKGQISKLLTDLENCTVVVKESYGPGRPNAWRLTAYGREVAAHFDVRETR